MDKYLKAPKFARNYFSFSTQNEYCLHTFSGVPLTSTPYINNIEDSEQIIFNNSEAGSFLSQRIYGKRWACSKIKISIFLTKKRIFFLFCFFFLLTLLAALCCIYSSILCKENKFIAENIKIREIFYKLDVCNFQDSNKDGRGDFLGIVQNLNYLKALGVSHIILTNLCFSVSNAHAQLFHDLNKLIDTSHVLGIKIIWDITRHIDEDGIKIFPKRIDGYFFSPAQYTVNSKKKLNPGRKFLTYFDLEILNNIEKSVMGNKSTWYIEVAIFEDKINYKMTDHLVPSFYPTS
ncbi:hypothetical protein HZS_2203 [Henneguya salminicola]|nr:hypothetical protein HZS_2203 [Henneguya salminicola]